MSEERSDNWLHFDVINPVAIPGMIAEGAQNTAETFMKDPAAPLKAVAEGFGYVEAVRDNAIENVQNFAGDRIEDAKQLGMEALQGIQQLGEDIGETHQAGYDNERQVFETRGSQVYGGNFGDEKELPTSMTAAMMAPGVIAVGSALQNKDLAIDTQAQLDSQGVSAEDVISQFQERQAAQEAAEPSALAAMMARANELRFGTQIDEWKQSQVSTEIAEPSAAESELHSTAEAVQERAAMEAAMDMER